MNKQTVYGKQWFNEYTSTLNTIYKYMNKSWINSSLMECSWIAACLTFHARLASKRSFACHRVKLTSLGGGFASWYVHLHKLSSHIMFLHVFLGFASATSAPTPIMKGCHALMSCCSPSVAVWGSVLNLLFGIFCSLFPFNGLPQVDVFAHLHQPVVTQSFREVS